MIIVGLAMAHPHRFLNVSSVRVKLYLPFSFDHLQAVIACMYVCMKSETPGIVNLVEAMKSDY